MTPSVMLSPALTGQKRTSRGDVCLHENAWGRRERRLLFIMFFTKDQTYMNQNLLRVVAMWEQHLELKKIAISQQQTKATGQRLAVPEVVDPYPNCSVRALDSLCSVYKAVTMQQNLRLKQLAWFMALNVSQDMRRQVVDGSADYENEPNAAATKFFTNLAVMLMPIPRKSHHCFYPKGCSAMANAVAVASKDELPLTLAAFYSRPQDRVRALMTAYICPTLMDMAQASSIDEAMEARRRVEMMAEKHKPAGMESGK